MNIPDNFDDSIYEVDTQVIRVPSPPLDLDNPDTWIGREWTCDTPTPYRRPTRKPMAPGERYRISNPGRCSVHRSDDPRWLTLSRGGVHYRLKATDVLKYGTIR